MHGSRLHARHRGDAGGVGYPADVYPGCAVLLCAPAFGVPAADPGCAETAWHRQRAVQYDGAFERDAYGEHDGDTGG